uniref:hypothetical protein n=4 Tax=Bordetella pertussis TaxID=520 RepID=UPI0021CAE625
MPDQRRAARVVQVAQPVFDRIDAGADRGLVEKRLQREHLGRALPGQAGRAGRQGALAVGGQPDGAKAVGRGIGGRGARAAGQQ